MRKGIFTLGCLLAWAHVAAGTPLYSNLAVTNGMAAAGRPDIAGGPVEIEPADDFILSLGSAVNEIKFIGLITGGTVNVSLTNLEIYRVFPFDSNTLRTPNVPTRANSPSDIAFAEVGASGISSFTMTTLSPSFTALNSVQNGIFPSPNQQTKGEGSKTGTEVLFDVVLSSPFLLPPDHYFFVPQIQVNGGDFFWLSASRNPIVPPGTPINPDLQAWIRNGNLDPDWLRIGTDIVGIIDGAPAPTFNMAFEIDGAATPAPEPTALLLVATGLGIVARRVKRKA